MPDIKQESINTPLVSIVILNWNGLEDTLACLESARRLNYKNTEIIVVDNGSDKRQKEHLATINDIVYIDNPTNRGFAGGQLDGYCKSKGDFILLLNNDAIIQHDYIDKALELFDDPNVGAVGGRSYFLNNDEKAYDETNRYYAYMEVDPVSAETTLLTSDNDAIQEVSVVSGSAVLVRRSVIEKTGYLHERFFAYYEETDLFARIKRAGYKVLYSPGLHIWHKNGASSGSSDGSYFFFYHIFRNRFIFAIRNFENDHLMPFIISYLKQGIKSLLSIHKGDSNKRLGISYFRAILYSILNLPSLIGEREKLTSQLGKSQYCMMLEKEQLKLSVIPMDAGYHDYAEHSPRNPYHEYVFYTNTSNHFDNASLAHNERIVIDKGYFNVNPLNLVCLASSMPWIVLSEVRPDMSSVIDATLNAQRQRKKVVRMDSTLIISREYFQFIGGFGTTSSQNIKDAVSRLAYIDKQLLNLSHQEIIIGADNRRSLKTQLRTYRALSQTKQHSLWQSIIDRNYRLFQIRNLIVFLCNPRVPLRLKLGRTRQILIAVARLDKKSLAFQLRHIHGERQRYGVNRHLYELNARQADDLQHRLSTSSAYDILETPVFIICYQRVETLKKMVGWLGAHGMKKIVFIDNASHYPPLLEYYHTSPYQILELRRNIGHTAPWSLGIIRILCPDDFYIVTDPDVIPIKYMPDDWLRHLYTMHQKHISYQKVGFGLKIDDIPNYYPLKNSVVKWESQFWKHPLDSDVFEAGVDTTFALYKPFTYRYFLHPSLRTNEPYVAQHMPWYVDPTRPNNEELYYRSYANKSITSWNVDELPDRYRKAMKK